MSRGAFHTSLVHEAMGRNPNRCSGANSEMNPSSFLPSSSSSSSSSQQISQSSTMAVNYPWQHNNQELTESWSQLLIGGGEEERYAQYQQYLAASAPGNNNIGHHHEVKHERSLGYNCFGHGISDNQVVQVRPPWSHVLPVSSPGSCVTTSSFSSNMLDFSKQKAEKRQAQLVDQSSECNSTQAGEGFKKSKGQAQSPFKVRKEKLGDRITALHQLVSPFGKTDTASVLLEAIGYIRFLQTQIEALSSPYLSAGSSGNRTMQRAAAGGGEGGEPEQEAVVLKDLRSRGLCLVPVSCTLHVGSNGGDNGADFWAPAFGGAGFLR